MAVPYYDLTKVKSDLNVSGTGLDTNFAGWNDEAEAEINDLLQDMASKARKLTMLPVLPFVSGSVPETVQGAADHFVKAKYYEYIRNPDLATMHEKKANAKVTQYIERLRIDKIIYGRIVS